MSRSRAVVALFALSFFSLLPLRAAAAETTCASAYESTQLLRHDGKLIAARDAALACARPGCPEVARRDCAGWSAQIEREIPSVIVVARDDATGDEGGARVTVDGVEHAKAETGRAFEIDPGAHVFRVERAGNEPVVQTITVVPGERDRVLRFSLRRSAAAPASAAAAPSAPREAAPVERDTERHVSLVPGAIVAGVSAIALATSAWLGLSGRSDLSQLRSSCAPACTDEQVDPVRRKLFISDVTLGAGLVGSAIAIYLFVRPPTVSTAASAHVDVVPTSHGASLSLRGAF